MQLGELQKRFVAGLNNPQHDNDAALMALLNTARYPVYRGNVMGAQLRAMEAALPVMQKILGEPYLAQLLKQQLIESPHTQRDLDTAANGFADWLDSQQTNYPELAAFPYLSDLTRLEVALHISAYAADRQVFDYAAFAQAAEQQTTNSLTLQLSPDIQLLKLKWPVDKLWLAQQSDVPGDVPGESGPILLLVGREGHNVGFQRLPAPLYGLLIAIQQETAFSSLADAHPAELLSTAIQQGLVDRFKP